MPPTSNTRIWCPADKISILAYDIDYDYSSTQTGGTFGFFWSKDLLTDTYLQTETTQGYRSNETEMFYIDAHFLDRAPDMVYSTLAHEFQHMLNFVHKAIKWDLLRATWYDEMLSMVCEDMMQETLGISDAESPKGRFPFFNYYYPYGFTTWLTGNSVLISYANAYAFGALLARNYGGAALVHEMAANSFVDMASVTAALHSEGYDGATCESVFKNMGQALVYTDSASGASHLSFNKSATATVGGYSFTFSPVDLMDYSENVDSVTYNGPIFYKPDSAGQVALGPWGFSVHSVGTFSGDVTLSLSPASSSEVLYVLVK